MIGVSVSQFNQVRRTLLNRGTEHYSSILTRICSSLAMDRYAPSENKDFLTNAHSFAEFHMHV